MNFFSSKTVEIDKNDIIKEGFLKKESRHRKVWRDRWCVLTAGNFYTFEKQGVYKNPTETIEVKDIKTVKTDDTKTGFFFKISLLEDVFIFEAKTFEEKESWIGSIGKAMLKGNKKPAAFIGNQ